MTFKQQLTEDMKQAMRDRNSVKLNTIRFLLSDIKNTEIDQGELDDAGAQKVLQKQVKQMKDAIAEYQKGGREDLVADEQEKVAILEGYLPEQLSDDDLAALVEEAVTEAPVKDMGPVIGIAMKKVAGRADGGRVSAMVKAKLG